MSTEIFQAVMAGATPKEIYDIAIEKYEGEVKGYQIMLQREEELNHVSEFTRKQYITMWKKEIRKSKYNLTRVRNLRKALE